MENIIREKIEKYGAEVLEENEILSTLSSTKDGELIQKFIEEKGEYDTIDFLKNSSIPYLEAFFGKNAFLIKSIISLYERRNDKKITRIKNPEDVFNLLDEELRYLKKEQAMVLLLDTKGNIIKKSIISIGSLNTTVIHPREVFSEAVKLSASHIIFVHNHPSQDPNPSKDDIESTHRLVKAGDIIGIPLADSIIIAGDKYISFKEKELL